MTSSVAHVRPRIGTVLAFPLMGGSGESPDCVVKRSHCWPGFRLTTTRAWSKADASFPRLKCSVRSRVLSFSTKPAESICRISSMLLGLDLVGLARLCNACGQVCTNSSNPSRVSQL